MSALSEKESEEHNDLLTLWATGKATKAQMLRCTALSQKASAHADSEFLEIGEVNCKDDDGSPVVRFYPSAARVPSFAPVFALIPSRKP